VTRIDQAGADDAAYERLRQHFDEKATVDLTILIGLINLFNRLAISMRYMVA
jgi:alkylhydroperoxidase family enzyme